jgi:hypothetical protein
MLWQFAAGWPGRKLLVAALQSARVLCGESVSE